MPNPTFQRPSTHVATRGIAKDWGINAVLGLRRVGVGTLQNTGSGKCPRKAYTMSWRHMNAPNAAEVSCVSTMYGAVKAAHSRPRLYRKTFSLTMFLTCRKMNNGRSSAENVQSVRTGPYMTERLRQNSTEISASTVRLDSTVP